MQRRNSYEKEFHHYSSGEKDRKATEAFGKRQAGEENIAKL